MKRSLLLSAAFLLSLTLPAHAITVTGHASAVIKATITATETQQMDFGIISATTGGGTVTMSPAGVKTSSLTSYGVSKASIFTIKAEPTTALTVSFANGTLNSSGNSMTLNNFTSTSSPASNTTDGSGNLTLNVGADLILGTNQASGSYTGTYNVTLSY